MNQDSIPDQFGEYRGHEFVIAARQEGELWKGHYRLLDVSEERAAVAGETGLHRWTPLDPHWATRNEAEMNAAERAHAAIDALFD